MVVLRVLLDQDGLFTPNSLTQLSKRCRQYMLQHPVLSRDILEGAHAIDHRSASDEEWAAWWKRWPIDRWLDIQNGERWFELHDDEFSFYAGVS